MLEIELAAKNAIDDPRDRRQELQSQAAAIQIIRTRDLDCEAGEAIHLQFGRFSTLLD